MLSQSHLTVILVAAVCTFDHNCASSRFLRRRLLRTMPTALVFPQIALPEKARLTAITVEIAQSHVHGLRVGNSIFSSRRFLAALQTREGAIFRVPAEVLLDHAIAVAVHIGYWPLLVDVHAQHVHIQAGRLHKRCRTDRTAHPLLVCDAPVMRQPPALVEHRVTLGTAHHRWPNQVAALAVLLQRWPVGEATAALGHVAHVAATHRRRTGQIGVAAMRTPVVHALAERVEGLAADEACEAAVAVVFGVRFGVGVVGIFFGVFVFCIMAFPEFAMAGQLVGLAESPFAEFATKQFGKFAVALGAADRAIDGIAWMVMLPLGGFVFIGEYFAAGPAEGQLLRLELRVRAMDVLVQNADAFEGLGAVLAAESIGAMDVLFGSS